MSNPNAYATYEPDSVAEPMCCDDPMVRNTWAGRYECASAFFALIDEGVPEDGLERLTTADVDDYLRTTLTHWRESWLSDELVWCATSRAGLYYHHIEEPNERGTVQVDCGRAVRWLADGEVVQRGWTGLRNGLPGLRPCPRCWPNGDPNALAQ